MDTPILDPPIPYIGTIYGGKFTPGKLVRIQGIASRISNRFYINLQCGPETTPQDDVAIQISVNILEGCISLNSSQDGVWDEEQRGAGLPIKHVEKFEIIIMCDFDKYKVMVNGQHYCDFPEKIHYDRITHLAIHGDVSIAQISYESTSLDGISSDLKAGAVLHTYVPSKQDENELKMIPPSVTSAPSSGINLAPPYGVPPTNTNFSGAPYVAPASANWSLTSPPPYAVGPPGATTYLPPPPGTMGAYPYAQRSDLGLPPPPPGPPVPLNFSSTRSKRGGWQKCCATCWGVIFFILLIIGIALKIAVVF